MTSIWDDIKMQFGSQASVVNRLIMINVAVFLTVIVMKFLAFLTGGSVLFDLATTYLMLPNDLVRLAIQPWSLVTYFFYHEGIWHILGNMLFLFYFGAIIEEYLGSKRLISLYVLGGLVGGLLFLLLYNLVPVLASNRLVVLYGASGAVYACVVGAATLLPNYTFNLILIGPVRIKYIALFYVVLSIVSAPQGNAGGHFAHLGGALLGFMFIRQLKNGYDLGKPITYIIGVFQNIFSRSPKLKVTSRNFQHTAARPTPTNSGNRSQRANYSGQSSVQLQDGRPSEAEIDDLLDKISKQGYEALSKEEKQKLFKASQG